MVFNISVFRGMEFPSTCVVVYCTPAPSRRKTPVRRSNTATALKAFFVIRAGAKEIKRKVRWKVPLFSQACLARLLHSNTKATQKGRTLRKTCRVIAIDKNNAKVTVKKAKEWWH